MFYKFSWPSQKDQNLYFKTKNLVQSYGHLWSHFHLIRFNALMVFSVLSRPCTLTVQIFRQPKKYPLLIQRSRPLRDSQEPKTRKKIQFSRALFQKIPFLYFFLHKFWIWRTLGHVTKKMSYCHFHNASKECFWPKRFF